MAKKAKTAVLEFLGTGTSTGVPIAGCRCPVCQSHDPRDKRLRSSVLLRNGKRNCIIDTGPEFRIQCLRAKVMNLDAVCLTHHHADHLFGLDDVRAYSVFRGKTLPVWGAENTLASIRFRFDYIWNSTQVGGGLPDIGLHAVTKPFRAAGLKIIPLPIIHGKLPILGFRIGDLAYMSDVSSVPESTLPLLEGLRTMIVSCVRYRCHKTHMSVPGVKRLHALVKPERTYLTHISHHFSHRDLVRIMPLAIHPAHDGLRVDIGLV